MLEEVLYFLVAFLKCSHRCSKMRFHISFTLLELFIFTRFELFIQKGVDGFTFIDIGFPGVDGLVKSGKHLDQYIREGFLGLYFVLVFFRNFILFIPGHRKMIHLTEGQGFEFVKFSGLTVQDRKFMMWFEGIDLLDLLVSDFGTNLQPGTIKLSVPFLGVVFYLRYLIDNQVQLFFFVW